MKVVSYYRVSTVEQVSGFSIDNQKFDIQRYCDAYGHELVAEFSDLGITGTSIEKRAGFQHMMDYIRKNKSVNAIIIWKLSRISRRMFHLVNILEDLKGMEVGLISVTDNINTFAGGEYFILLAGIFADMERENIIMQTTGGLRQRARSGKWNGGHSPLGYYDTDGELYINKDEKALIELIFHLYVNKNLGYYNISKHLNQKGYQTRNGNPWKPNAVKKLLDNPVYAGYIEWGTNKYRKKKKKQAEPIFMKGIHEPIITEELWQQAKAKRSLANKIPTHHNTQYILSSLLRCPQCSAGMIAQNITRKNKNGTVRYYRYYACGNWNSNKTTCRPNNIKADEAERVVIQAVKNFINSSEIIEELEKRFKNKNDVKEITDKLNALNKKLGKLKASEDLYYNYLGDEEQLKELKVGKVMEILSRLNSEMQVTVKEINELQILKENKTQSTVNLQQIKAILERFEAVFDRTDPDRKKELLRILIKEIRIEKSDKIDDRKVKEVVFNFTNNTLKNFINKKENRNNVFCYHSSR